MVPLPRWQWPLTQAQPTMSDPKSKFSTRVEVFTRATADALNRAIGEVLDARNPWQLLYRLSRIVFLGLVLVPRQPPWPAHCIVMRVTSLVLLHQKLKSGVEASNHR